MYAVWLIPSTNDRILLEKIIFNLAEKYNSPKFTPHITTYGLNSVPLDELEHIVSNSIKDMKSFDVSTLNIDYSDDIWKTLFINIQMNSNLETIFKNLHKQLGNTFHYDYSPHLSLIYKKISDKEKKFLSINLKILDKFRINKIAIQEFFPDITKWKLVKEIQF